MGPAWGQRGASMGPAWGQRGEGGQREWQSCRGWAQALFRLGSGLVQAAPRDGKVWVVIITSKGRRLETGMRVWCRRAGGFWLSQHAAVGGEEALVCSWAPAHKARVPSGECKRRAPSGARGRRE